MVPWEAGDRRHRSGEKENAVFKDGKRNGTYLLNSCSSSLLQWSRECAPLFWSARESEFCSRKDESGQVQRPWQFPQRQPRVDRPRSGLKLTCTRQSSSRLVARNDEEEGRNASVRQLERSEGLLHRLTRANMQDAPRDAGVSTIPSTIISLLSFLFEIRPIWPHERTNELPY